MYPRDYDENDHTSDAGDRYPADGGSDQAEIGRCGCLRGEESCDDCRDHGWKAP